MPEKRCWCDVVFGMFVVQAVCQRDLLTLTASASWDREEEIIENLQGVRGEV